MVQDHDDIHGDRTGNLPVKSQKWQSGGGWGDGPGPGDRGQPGT